MSRLLRALFGPVTLRVLGAIAVVALIWLAGPLLAFAGWHPLDPGWARMAVIGVVLIAWFGRRLLGAIRATMQNRRLVDAIAPPAAAGESAAQVANRQRFEQALRTLRDARFSAAGGRGPRWARRGRHLYQLPWYLFIGPPGSGKTTALMHSGLHFPLAGRDGQDPLAGVGGTRNCQWWFTDQAVLIDTAGRYTTQDSDRAADGDEWQGFLRLLQRFRPRQPINGVLLTVSAADLIQQNRSELERHAAAVRARLDELGRTLGVTFPVYLLVTKCDLLAGFTEFFDDLDQDRREQVWGVTFDFDPQNPRTGEPPLADELLRLGERLHSRVNARLHGERSPQRRASIFNFPSQFALLRPALLDYVRQALGPSALVSTPLLRGVYFTSGTQEGSPIDRLVGSLGRAFGVERALLAPQQSSGRAYFLNRLLHDVVFAESSLAGTNLAWEQRLTLAKRLIAGATVAAVAIAGIGWTLSFLKNRDYVEQVGAQSALLEKALVLGQRRDSAESIAALLPLLDRVRGSASTPAVQVSDKPTSLGWGLFQGDKLDDAALFAYRRMLSEGLAPLLSQRIEDMLRQPPATPELQFETLKAYVMLFDRDHLNAAALKGWVAFDAEARMKGTLDERGRAALMGHVDALLERDSILPGTALDTALVDRVRRSLLSTPFPQRVVDRIRRQGLPADIQPFRVTQAAGNSAQLVFVRPSGAALTDGVAAFHTHDGYHKGFQKLLDPFLTQLAHEETWVLGQKNSDNARRAADPALRASLADEVRAAYLRDYAAVWERFVADIGLMRSGSLEQSIQTARLLSAQDSPLPRLLRAIVREVTLAEREETPGSAATKGVVEKAAEAARSTQQDLMKLLGAAASPGAGVAPGRPVKVESIVDDRFDALRRFVRPPAPNQPAPLDTTLQLVTDLYNTLIATDTALRSGMPAPPNDLANRVRAEGGRMPEPVRTMLTSLSGAGTSQAAAATRGNLSQSLGSAVGEFCTRALAGRYPFTRGSAQDVTPDDFARLFSSGGILDEFFQKNLAPHVDTATKPWTFRRQADAKVAETSPALIQFQRAEEIRRTFFPAGARAPSYRFEIRPLEMDASILQLTLDVDGQLLKYAHGPVVPMTVAWPGPKGTSQIRLQASPGTGGGDGGLLFEGPWAPFRMFDRGQVEKTAVPERFRVSYSLGGRRVVFEVTTSSVQNPFRLPELQAFSCPTRL
jgi:type VI secretion system protein ImpL